MPKKIRIRKSKILFYYFLAIVLPSVVLGALAFRGVINDQAIHERESRQQLTEAGANIITASDHFLSGIEEDFLQKSKLCQTPDTEAVFFEDSILSELLTEKPEIESIFYIPNSGKVQILKSGLLYFPDGTFSQKKSSITTGSNINPAKGWQYEFREKEYQKALKYYQNLIKKTKNESVIASLLIPVARIQKKQLKYTDAINTYRQIEQKYGHERMNSGIPLGAIALMEIGRLNLSMGDTLNALKSTNYLVSLTLKSHWDLEISQYKQLISASNELIRICKNCTNEVSLKLHNQTISTLDELAILADNTNQQLAFQDKAELVINELAYKSPESKSEYRVYLNMEQKAILLSVFTQSGKGQWGIIYNLSEFLNQLTKRIIPGEKQKLDFQWQILKEGREMLAHSQGDMSKEIKSTAVFPSYMPSWSLVLCKGSTGMISTFLKASQGIFIYIFLFIVIVLILGLFFTLQIINKELLLSKLKSDFISTVSHEFKSPLTSIRQMSEMLFNERIKTESKKKEYYAVMLEQSERLSHLIDNILDFSKIEEGEKAFRFEKTNLKDLIDRVKLVFQKSIANEGFSVISSVPETLPELVIDKEAIQQVLYNLLDNAYKYSGDSRNIEIIAASTGNSVKISVKDFGIGIQPEEQDKIFDRFFRGGNELTRSVKGSGIGLTIVKKIIEAHGGTVSLDSTPGKGSTFQVILPIEIKTEL